MLFICYPACGTCRKAREWLEKNKIQYQERNIKTDNPSVEEIEKWQKMNGTEIKKFFNTSGQIYKKLNLKEKLPQISRDEQIQLLATDGMLVKRPILVGDDFVITGFKEDEWKQKLLKE